MQVSRFCRSIPVTIALAASLTSNFCQGATAGSVSGMLRTNDGIPVEGAVVMARSQSPSNKQKPLTSARSGADGSFTISGLPRGRYEICVRDRKQGLLDPCRWSSSPPSVDLTASDQYHLPVITLRKGRLLQVHIVDDSGHLLASPQRGADVLVGVWNDDGFFVTIPLKTSDSKSRLHVQYVPVDKPIQLSVSSQSNIIADENGVPGDAKRGVRKQIDFPPGNQPINVTFHATGANR